MSVHRFAVLLRRAALNYGELTGADMADALLMRDAELVKQVEPDMVVPRFKLTVLGWRLARKLAAEDMRAACEDERARLKRLQRRLMALTDTRA